MNDTVYIGNGPQEAARELMQDLLDSMTQHRSQDPAQHEAPARQSEDLTPYYESLARNLTRRN